MINDHRVLADVNRICIVDGMVGSTVLSHIITFIPVESSYI